MARKVYHKKFHKMKPLFTRLNYSAGAVCKFIDFYVIAASQLYCWHLYPDLGSLVLIRFTVRRRLCRCNVLAMAELSVRLSVCPSVTRADSVSKRRKLGSWNLHRQLREELSFGIPKTFQKYERGHPDRGRWMTESQRGAGRISDFQPVTHRIAETVRYRAKVTIDH